MNRPVTILVPSPPDNPRLTPFIAHLGQTAGMPCQIVPVPGAALSLNAAMREAGKTDIVIAIPGLHLVTPEWLVKLQARIEADPKLGAVGPKFFDRAGLIYSCGRSVISRFGMREHLSNLGFGESDTLRFQRFTEADALLPWVIYLRREALDAAGGGFDEQLARLPVTGPTRPPRMESDDLCLAMRAKGFSVAVDPFIGAVNANSDTYNDLKALTAETPAPETDAHIVNFWRKKWRWHPDYPELHEIRAKWGETPLCWRIGKTLLDAWDEPEPRVDLLLVTRNNLNLLKPMLESLAGTAYGNARLWLHLNGSTDGSQAHLEKLRDSGYPFPIHLAESPVNIGYPPAMNWLLHLSDAPLVAKLDDDIEIEPDWLSKMVARLRAHPYAGVVGAKVVNFDDPTVIQWADYRIWPRVNNHAREKDEGQFNYCVRTTANMGCCALYRRKVFATAGDFDIGLNPVSWDDLDHQIAVWAAGYDVLYDGGITVKHPYKPLRDLCKRVYNNQLGNGLKAHRKWGVGAFQALDKGLDLAGRAL